MRPLGFFLKNVAGVHLDLYKHLPRAITKAEHAGFWSQFTAHFKEDSISSEYSSFPGQSVVKTSYVLAKFDTAKKTKIALLKATF